MVAASPPSPPRPGGSAAASGRALAASAALAARFLPVWLATGALAVVAEVFAPATLQRTSWSFILPLATVLALATVGQMLVIMQAGIDLSTPGLIVFGGSLIAGVGAGASHNLPVAILACLGVAVGLANGVLVGLLRLNPSLAGGLAGATSTWLAALALTVLTQMLVVMGLSTAMQYVVFGAAIIAGMVVSGDRVAAVLGRILRPVTPVPGEASAGG